MWPLVGRSRELERIASVIAGDETSGIVLAGEAGVGKTRLAEEALTVAQRAGFDTDRVIATRAAQSVPLGALAPLVPRRDPDAGLRHDALQESVAALVERSGERPFMLAVDDVQWLDNGSAVVLHQLLATGEVAVVVTHRADDPVPDPIAALWKDGFAERVEVGPLSRRGTEELLGAVLDGPIDGATLADLWWSSQGNPLFLRELVVGAVEAGFLTAEGGLWRMRAPLTTSPRLVELVGARLTDLDPAERSALEVVAFGEPLPLGLLATLADESAAESLERRGLVFLEASTEGRRIRLAHPLYGEILRERTPELRAMAVQRRLAETVQERGVRADEELRVGVWLLESEGDAEPVLMTTAARSALLAQDESLAERLARAAIDLGAGPDAKQILGEALYLEGRHAEAVDVLGGALTGASTDRQRALIALTMAEALFNGLGEPDRATAVLDRAADSIKEVGWHEEVLALRSVYRLFAGDVREAIDEVSRLIDPSHERAFVVAATVTAPALTLLGTPHEAIEVADEAFATHVELGPQENLGHPGIHLVARTLALSEAGHLEEAVATAAAGYEGAVADRSGHGQGWFALIRGRSLWLSDLVEAERWFRQAALAFEQAGYGGQRRWCLAGGAFVAAHRGNLETAHSLWRAIDDLPHGHIGLLLSDVRRAHAWMTVAAGRVAEAIDELTDAAEIARRSECPILELAALHDVARLGHADQVADRTATVADGVEGALAAARASHVRALADGDPEDLDDAATSFATIGVDVLAAEAHAHAAAAWSHRREPRPAQRSAQLADELATRAGGLSTPALLLAGPAATLTKREREVASLAAGGLTNREIAEELFVSIRTVGNHLQRAYSKLGVDGRESLTEVLKPGQRD